LTLYSDNRHYLLVNIHSGASTVHRLIADTAKPSADGHPAFPHRHADAVGSGCVGKQAPHACVASSLCQNSKCYYDTTGLSAKDCLLHFAGGVNGRLNPAENDQLPNLGFAPPSHEPSPGALHALLTLALGFAIALALYAAFDASTQTGIHLPSTAGLSQ
jgi:hypothetical protein